MADQVAFKDAHEYLAGLPQRSIGPLRLLSRALYRLSYDHAKRDCLKVVSREMERHGRDVVLEHLTLLPDHGWDWIIGGFREILQDYADSEGDDMKWHFTYLSRDIKPGIAEEVISKKWAADVVRDAIQMRSAANRASGQESNS